MNKSELVAYISNFLPFNCYIEIKNKNNHLINVKKGILVSKIYLHPVFLKADKNILQDVVNYIIQKKEKNELSEIKKRLSEFFENNRIKRKINISKKFFKKNIFEFYDNIIKKISNVFSDINFDILNITWGKYYSNQKRSIRFGSYDKKNHLIRIHPILDNDIIPDFFIKSIIYHEIVHFIIFSYNKQSLPHAKEFKDLLKKIDPDYKISSKWEKENKKIFFYSLIQQKQSEK